MPDPSDFYAHLPVFTDFADLTDPDRYRALPAGWLVGVADVVNSTQAILRGRYKVVNTAGAAIIAALTNGLQGREFPFAFGGDGASFAVAADCEAQARGALAATAAWARDELDLDMRVGLAPVEAVRDAGLDVRVARFAPSPHVTYAMFAGGGVAWAGEALKAGRFALDPGPTGARPDLTGLSCRWEEIGASRGVMLSLVLVPLEDGEHPGFRTLVRELLTWIETSPDVVRPLRDESIAMAWPIPGGVDLEARARRRAGGSLLLERLRVLGHSLMSTLIFRTGRPIGRFDPRAYRSDLVENSDFRKYDDGLRMTLDCTPEMADRIEERLARAERDGIARFGLHRQGAAILTCITPSIHDRRHVHFLDGAAGGYALAARQMKERAGLTA